MSTDLIFKKILERRSDFCCRQPKRKTVRHFIYCVLAGLFPHFETDLIEFQTPAQALNDSQRLLRDLLQAIDLTPGSSPEEICELFAKSLPKTHELLVLDANAILAGDPAAASLDEVIISYPGFFAIAVHRLAHELYLQSVPMLPRMLSEYAHQKTGIDIHPGARIGSSFCIDHGTGLVIGETSHIGSHVKLYQGVTLGGLSVEKSMASTKRHPTIEDNVVVYANATILGGHTVIGANTVIGGSVWITESVPANSTVYFKSTTEIKTGP